MSRIVLISVLVSASLATPLPAAASVAAAQANAQTCQQSPARQTRRSILGGIGGAVAGGLLGSNRVTSTISSVLPVQSLLTDALMNLLDTCEQQKAAQATDEVTARAERGGVGTTAEWTSDTRPGVRGRSTVTAVDNPGQGGQRCMTVTDIVIIDGEETSVPKRMCRTPPSTRYARA
ncbi:MAG: hypothetical protein ACK4SZ_05105 [Allosphingosinicella sp.]|uniref:hypothetical protein n=1 Tax=Allosphingosinicella sp. TaxID=2823234 RepID=UPI0039363BB1